MTTADFTASNVQSSMDRINEASILLCRAISLNDLLFEIANNGGGISDDSLSGATDAINSILISAKCQIDSFSGSDFKGEE